MAASPHLCLRWNNYQSNLTSVFDQLLQNETFVDVTLAADGHAIKAHRMVLSACSPYFQALFFDNPCQHPIVILKDTRWSELKAIVEYMYRGEISVAQEELSSLLRVAETLKIRGLSELSNSERHTAEAGDDRSDSCSPVVAATVSATPTGLDARRVTSPGASWPPQPVNWSREETPTPSPRPAKRRRGSVTERSSPVSPAGSTPASLGGQQHEEGSLEGPLPLISGNSHVTPTTTMTFPTQQQPQQQQQATLQQHSSAADDLDIKPGIAELIREEERARMLEGAHPWLTTSSTVLSDPMSHWRSKAPSWSKEQLQEAIQAIVTQRMRFTQAATHYGIPKGTLYDNILGKSKRMLVLDEVALDSADEEAVLDFCCETSVMPYNRRTNKSLESIITFVEKLKRSKGKSSFSMSGLMGFRWWWAFCKKHNIVSLFYAKNKLPTATPTVSNNNNNSSSTNNNISDKVVMTVAADDGEMMKKLSFYRTINNNLQLNQLKLSQALMVCHQQQFARSRNHSVEQDEESDPEPENLSVHKN